MLNYNQLMIKKCEIEMNTETISKKMIKKDLNEPNGSRIVVNQKRCENKFVTDEAEADETNFVLKVT